MLQHATLNLQLPLMQPAQAQKHVTHNEALQHLDALLGLRLEGVGQDVPPSDPVAGQVWATGLAPEGAWAGHGDVLAVKLAEGWLFVPAKEGLMAWDAAAARVLVWQEGAWSPLAQEDLAGLGIGTTSDALNVLAVSGPASLFSHSGAGHQLKVNKASAGQTASVLLQSNWSGRAELGLMGQDKFALKVSADGSTWREAFHVDAEAWMQLGAGIKLPVGDVDAPSLTFAAEDDLGIFRAAAGTLAFAKGGAVLARLGDALTIDVPVGGSAVVQSSTDATAGRLVTAGWMGLGAQGAAALVTDLDDLTCPTGTWSKPAIAISGTLPPGIVIGQACYLRLERLAADTLCQTLWPSDPSGAGGTWQRMSSAGIWGVWRQIQPSALIGIVAQNAGLPTGALFETGTTATGEYLRLADGTQICTVSALELLRETEGKMSVVWTLPKAFVGPSIGGLSLPQDGTAYIGLTPEMLGAGFWQAATATIVMGQRKAYGAPSLAVGATIEGCSAFAIGRWF